MPYMWSHPAVSMAQRSTEDAVARAKLEDYVDEEEIGPSTGKAYHVLPSLMSRRVEKGSADLPTLRGSRQVKKASTKRS